MKKMPSVAKYHIFKEKNFQGLVYCDYCAKLLWGLARQGVQCTGNLNYDDYKRIIPPYARENIFIRVWI
jgi:hypothetical protein